jgi:hypothetical protein
MVQYIVSSTYQPQKNSIDTECKTGVLLQTDDGAWKKGDAVEFFAVLRCALLQIVRWIERRYPESVK